MSRLITRLEFFPFLISTLVAQLAAAAAAGVDQTTVVEQRRRAVRCTSEQAFSALRNTLVFCHDKPGGATPRVPSDKQFCFCGCD